ncbi:MAG: ABC-F family ATP-binding cassette domain-containing protein [Candidatus Latescibacteria bacterium]|jgi:ATP-binding cassette, subfamily F, member 3|nr:ABC-F family ATP-binding cassette domain-containing protein [Candidatus Latescibacterota bacterium]
MLTKFHPINQLCDFNMPLITLNEIWKAYGANDILQGISWQIDPGEKIGLVGHNGCGKTTLFGVLTGRHLPDQGQMHQQRNIHIGFLDQEPKFKEGQTVFDAALEGFADLLHIQHQLRDMELSMSDNHDEPGFLDQYGKLRDSYELDGGYALEARVKAILFGLGFRETDLNLPTEVLSGGQKNRLALAQLLSREPDLLLLDEPTNHLDLQALEWLEHFLLEYNHAFVIISHDRYFLERTVTQIVEIVHGQAESYPGSYSFYVKEKALRLAQQQKAFDAQQSEIARTEDYIRRNIAGQKTKQAQSRRRALEKVDRIDSPTERRKMGLKFSTSTRGGDRVYQIEGLSKGYENRDLFDDLDLIIWRGDRLGIIGPNGTGKSTLLKIITGELTADAGTIIPGSGLEVGYFDQTRQDLNPKFSVLDEVGALTPQVPTVEIRSFLGAFLFSGDDVERKVGDLSGGEQSRVALAKLMRTPSNLLALDEPTNHLDIASRNVLEEALENFSGTLITVSHDRYFLNRLVNRLLVLEEGSWRIIEGNYDTYQASRQKEVETQASTSPTATKEDHKTRKRLQREQERARRRTAELEKTIAKLEEKMQLLDTEMAREDLATDWDKLKELSQEKSSHQAQIEALFSEWESLENELASKE